MAVNRSSGVSARIAELDRKNSLTGKDLESLADLMLAGKITGATAGDIIDGKPVKLGDFSRASKPKYSVSFEEGESTLTAKKRNGDLVGDMQFSFLGGGANKTLIVNEVYVQPGEKNKGYGLALMDAAERIARREDAEKMLLEVDKANPNAISFYEGFGFREVHAVNSTDIDRIWMVKRV